MNEPEECPELRAHRAVVEAIRTAPARAGQEPLSAPSVAWLDQEAARMDELLRRREER